VNDTPKFRVTTVQFAIPQDDLAFELTFLRGMIQDQFYDAEGMSGSFVVVGTQEYDEGPLYNIDGEYSAAADFFDEYEGVRSVEWNAKGIIEAEVVERDIQRADDLLTLEEWAKWIAADDNFLTVRGNDPETEELINRLVSEGLLFLKMDRYALTCEGFAAIGWGV